jgi:hypothetical protein
MIPIYSRYQLTEIGLSAATRCPRGLEREAERAQRVADRRILGFLIRYLSIEAQTHRFATFGSHARVGR